MNNWLGLVICIAYIFGLIGIAELLRRWRGYKSSFTRKVIHIGVGMMSWGLHFLFDNPWFFIVTAVGFMLINLLDWRYGFFAAMASSDRSNLGTVYFPFAAAVVAYLFWDQPPLMVAYCPLAWLVAPPPTVASRPLAVPTESADGSRVVSPDVRDRSLVLFDAGDEVVVRAGEQGIRFLLVSGRPFREPVAWRGPIVMNTDGELRQAYRELQDGTSDCVFDFFVHGLRIGFEETTVLQEKWREA